MESPSMLAPTANVARPSSSFLHRHYILLKAHYFLFFSAFGTVYPILNITLRSRGLSNTELSYINLIIPFLVFFTNPLLGFLADHSRRYLSTFNIVVTITMILYTIMFLLPTVKTHHIRADVIPDPQLGYVMDFCASQEVATKCASRSNCGCSYQANCTPTNPLNQTKYVVFTFSMNSKGLSKEVEGRTEMSEAATCGIQYRVPVQQSIEQYTAKHHFNPFPFNPSLPRVASCEITCSIAHYCHGSRYPNQTRFILLYALLFILANNFLSNAIPLGASIGFASLSRPDIFGKQRVFGTVGFGVIAFAASRIYGEFQTEFVYLIMFCIAMSLCMIVTSFIRIHADKKDENIADDQVVVEEKEMEDLPVEKKKKKSPFQSSALLSLLQKIDVLVFLSLTLIWGVSYAGLDPFLYLYIDEIAACQSHSIVGWMSLVSAISEIAGFFLADRILKFLGTNLASIVILLAFTLRFAGYYFIREPYFLIAMETMHFFNFGILYVLTVRKADSIAPPGLSGTLQGVALGVSFGLGRGIGLLIASFIYTLIEARLLFLIIAVFNLIAAIIFSLYFLLNRQRSDKKENIVAEYDIKSKEEPLLVVSTKNQINKEEFS